MPSTFPTPDRSQSFSMMGRVGAVEEALLMEEEEEEELAWLGHVKSSVVSNSIFHSESSSLYVSCLTSG